MAHREVVRRPLRTKPQRVAALSPSPSRSVSFLSSWRCALPLSRGTSLDRTSSTAAAAAPLRFSSETSWHCTCSFSSSTFLAGHSAFRITGQTFQVTVLLETCSKNPGALFNAATAASSRARLATQLRRCTPLFLRALAVRAAFLRFGRSSNDRAPRSFAGPARSSCCELCCTQRCWLLVGSSRSRGLLPCSSPGKRQLQECATAATHSGNPLSGLQELLGPGQARG